jgi:hypothetical protein
MANDPIDFVRTQLPARFAAGVNALRVAAGPRAKEELEDVLSARAGVRLVIEGAGEIWLEVDGGQMRALDAPSPRVPTRAAIACPADVIEDVIALLADGGALDDPESATRFARSFSARAEKILEGQTLEFHLVLEDVPDRDDVVVRVGVGTAEPPLRPQFSAALSYDDIEDLRAGDLTPQQIVGRLRLTGDASRAMALGMRLMQTPTKR